MPLAEPVERLRSRPMTQDIASLAAVLIVGYLLGSIPFGLLLTRFAGLGDIRTIGSGNIGATNVLRTGNKGLAAATVLLDGLKGTVPVLIGAWVSPEAALAGGFGAFIGHLFPVWLNFKGGKGIATYIGALAAVSLPAGLAFGAVWIATAAATRFSSASALLASLLTPVLLWFIASPAAALVFLAMTAITWWRHEANIRRLLAGTETRIGEKK
jgi:acyl phosphate:glycerol-3-phosphate acyltransferase